MIWDKWVGSLDGVRTMYVKHLLALWGWRLDLHKFVGWDDPGCHHTHPSWAIRLVLRGGYVEQLENGTRYAWQRGDVGLVRTTTSHRVDALLGKGPCYTLWLRSPGQATVQLRGHGWPPEKRTFEDTQCPHGKRFACRYDSINRIVRPINRHGEWVPHTDNWCGCVSEHPTPPPPVRMD
jgi:hypothetical protein